MKHLLLCAAFLLPVFFMGASAQGLRLTTFAGMGNYQGDLQAKGFTLQHANLALGIGLSYEITDQLYVTTGVKVSKVGGNDNTTANALRNLNFSSPITEFQVGLEYDLFNLKERSLTPYFFGGLAIYHFNPSTIDSNGNKVYLQPLGTEGQGFYEGRKKYTRTQLSVPFGAGIKFALTDNIRIGLELGFRKTFTDYIDDVSTTYVDKTLLTANNGTLAAALAFRGDELKTALPYPADGAKRGNPNAKDWYYFSGLSVSFNIGTSEQSKRYGGRSNTGCPVNVN